jgi:hypothetical protein
MPPMPPMPPMPLVEFEELGVPVVAAGEELLVPEMLLLAVELLLLAVGVLEEERVYVLYPVVDCIDQSTAREHSWKKGQGPNSNSFGQYRAWPDPKQP